MNGRQLHARRAAAARWNRPEGQRLGQWMAWHRLLAEARSYRQQFGPVEPGGQDATRIGAILWGVEPPGSQNRGW